MQYHACMHAVMYLLYIIVYIYIYTHLQYSWYIWVLSLGWLGRAPPAMYLQHYATREFAESIRQQPPGVWYSDPTKGSDLWWVEGWFTLVWPTFKKSKILVFNMYTYIYIYICIYTQKSVANKIGCDLFLRFTRFYFYWDVQSIQTQKTENLGVFPVPDLEWNLLLNDTKCRDEIWLQSIQSSILGDMGCIPWNTWENTRSVPVHSGPYTGLNSLTNQLRRSF